jgi:hypothetical protein
MRVLSRRIIVEEAKLKPVRGYLNKIEFTHMSNDGIVERKPSI